jgi:hypothetical protein
VIDLLKIDLYPGVHKAILLGVISGGSFLLSGGSIFVNCWIYFAGLMAPWDWDIHLEDHEIF